MSPLCQQISARPAQQLSVTPKRNSVGMIGAERTPDGAMRGDRICWEADQHTDQWEQPGLFSSEFANGQRAYAARDPKRTTKTTFRRLWMFVCTGAHAGWRWIRIKTQRLIFLSAPGLERGSWA